MPFHSNAPLLLRSTPREPRYSRAPAACYPFPAPRRPTPARLSAKPSLSIGKQLRFPLILPYPPPRRTPSPPHRPKKRYFFFQSAQTHGAVSRHLVQTPPLFLTSPKTTLLFPCVKPHCFSFSTENPRFCFFPSPPPITDHDRPPTLAPASPTAKGAAPFRRGSRCRDKIPVIPIKRIHVASPAANRAESVPPFSPPRRHGRMVRFPMIATRSRISYGERERARKARRYSGAVIPSGGLRRVPFSPLSAPVSAPQSASEPC